MPTPNILGQYTNTYKLATALVKTFPQYKKYKPEQFIDMLQQIAISETGDRNIVQENKGPGRGHFQVETPRPGDKQNVAAITAYNRAKNTLEELKKYGSKENLTLPKYNEDFTKIDKDAQAFYTLSNMLGNAQQARKTDPKAYVDPTNPADSWRDYHWVGDRKAADYQKVKKERMQHWKETVVNYKPIVVETSKEAAPTTQAPKQAVPTQAPTQAPTTTPIGTFVPSIQNDPWLQKFEDGGSINDQKIPTPTTPSFYPAGQDRTLTNYQRGTPKAPMYAAGSTVWTNQDTPLWAAGSTTPTSTQHFRNTGSLNTDRYRIGDVIPTGMDYKTPSAGTHDYNQDVQPYRTMRLHAPDTTMMGNGGHTPIGGLWDTNRKAFVDSTLQANTDKEWIKRLYNNSAGSIQIPGEKDRSTHYMANDNTRAYPEVVNINGKLTYLPGDQGYDYADETKSYINFNYPKQADWFASNGYKIGTNVLNSIDKNGTPVNNPNYVIPKHAHGGHIKKHINSPRVYGSPVNPSGMSEGPTSQRGGMMFEDGGWINKYEDGGITEALQQNKNNNSNTWLDSYN